MAECKGLALVILARIENDQVSWGVLARVATKRFFKIHIHHLDLVCFRATIYCKTLTDWCEQGNVILYVNKFTKSHYEILLILKL